MLPIPDPIRPNETYGQGACINAIRIPLDALYRKIAVDALANTLVAFAGLSLREEIDDVCVPGE